MDIGLPTSSPRGVNFMPSSPPTANGVQPWPEDLNEEFMDFVITRKNLMLFDSIKALRLSILQWGATSLNTPPVQKKR